MIEWYGTAYADIDSFIATKAAVIDCGGTVCFLAKNRACEMKSLTMMYIGESVEVEQ